MTQPPFAPLPGQLPMFLSEQYSLLTAHLSSATEQTDCMMVICGADGSGKTLLLNRYIASLGEDVSYATFDETCADGVQFYCVLLRQLGFQDITGSLKELRHIAREFLIHRGKANDPVLLIIDNAHLVKASVFEQLRWLAETKVEERRVLSMVLAGNADLPRILESPAMRSIQFRSRINFNIRVYSEEETGDYVRHRLRLAGGITAAKFSDDARPLIYRFTGGVPKSINELCNELLSEAHARKTRVISANLVRSVADSHQFELPAHPPENKRRRKTDSNIKLVKPDQRKAERITSRQVAPMEAGKESDIYVQDLLDQISVLSGQTGEFKAASKQALRDVGERDERIARLSEQLAQTESDLEQSRSDMDHRDEEIRGLKVQLAQFEAAWEQARSDIGGRDEEIARLKAQFVEAESGKELTLTELGARDAEIAELRKQLEKINSEFEQARSDIGARDGEIDALRAQLAEVGSEQEQALTKIVSRDEKIVELKEQLAKYESDKELALSDIRARDGEIGELKEQLAEYESDKELALSEIRARDGEIGELRERVSELDSQSQQALLDMAARDKEIVKLEKQLAARTKESERLASRAEDKADKIRQLKNDLSENNSVLKKSEKVSDKYSNDLVKEQNATERAKEALAMAEAKIERLDRINSELQTSVSELTRDLRQANGEVGRNELLEARVAAFQEDIDSNARELVERDKKLCELEKSLHEVQKERESLRGSADAMGELEQRLADKEARIAELETTLSSLIQENARLEAQPSGNQALARSSKSETKVKTGITNSSASEESARPISRLEVFKGGKIEKTIEIAEGTSRIMIGRNDDCDLCLESEYVSRHHALIFFAGERVHIEDLNSFNGTIVNSKRFVRCDLKPDDDVVIGDFHIRPRRT